MKFYSLVGGKVVVTVDIKTVAKTNKYKIVIIVFRRTLFQAIE